jgi:hypothetical protein
LATPWIRHCTRVPVNAENEVEDNPMENAVRNDIADDFNEHNHGENEEANIDNVEVIGDQSVSCNAETESNNYPIENATNAAKGDIRHQIRMYNDRGTFS